uniref:Uncharacterized protein n=1 Tax=Arundo donax TaxID=35708 RepID=A0A0A9FW65_ARUDO
MSTWMLCAHLSRFDAPTE